MKLKLTVDGKVYEVEVEVDEPQRPYPSYVPPAQARGPAPGADAAAPDSAAGGATSAPGGEAVDEAKVCRTPISGVVVRVSAQVGQEIHANDVLMVLEAMKMETEITSPVDGKVAQVHAAAGDSVQGGQILVEFE